MSASQATKVGRLALRQEGDLWVAYFADSDTMEGAIYLGSIRMAFVMGEEMLGLNRGDIRIYRQSRKAARKAEFIAFMREAVGDILEEQFGVRPLWPEGTKPAPEHERGVTVANPFLR